MMLRRLVDMVLLINLVGMSGCATKTLSAGSFVSNAPTTLHATLEADALLQMTKIFPPAKTRLTLQSTTDPFGVMLINDLRAKGYALQENASAASARHAPDALPFRYIVDQTQDSSLFRTTLQIGEQTLSRAYVLKNGVLSPAGAWSRQEQVR